MSKLSPKNEWLLSAQAADFQKLIEDPLFRSACLAAFAEFCWNLPIDTNPTSGMHFNSMRAGATSFLKTLENISQKPEPRVQITGLEKEE